MHDSVTKENFARFCDKEILGRTHSKKNTHTKQNDIKKNEHTTNLVFFGCLSKNYSMEIENIVLIVPVLGVIWV
jgi:hypothetical protein